MKRIIAALQVSVDGMIEGPNAELDWITDWGDDYGLTAGVDTCVLGGGMYPGYEQYWTSILADPHGIQPFSGKRATPAEIAYANWSDQTPHIVLSTTISAVDWQATRIVRRIEDIRALREGDGKDIYAVGGATFVSSLMNENLVDELRLVVHPVVLGAGTPLFKNVADRHRLRLVSAEAGESGHVRVTYRTP